MIDLTQKHLRQLPEELKKIRDWQIAIDRAANEAQRKADEAEVLDGRSLKRALLKAEVKEPKP